MDNFTQLDLPAPLLASLQVMQFETPTPIQAKTIPFALEGKDILGSAQTGTGKTGAYGIPLVSHLMNNPEACALVLLPTRELATQVLDTLKIMLGGRQSPIRSALLIGGDSMYRQMRQLEAGPRLVVGTPGRINDHISRGTLSVGCVTFFVLDETDRMLDMGFSIQIQQITKLLPKERQTLMFSATMSPTILKTAQSYLNNPKEVACGAVNNPIEKIKQEIIKISEEQKYGALMDKLSSMEGSFIVFVKTKFATERLARKLYMDGVNAAPIHGDLRQKMRDRVISEFRSKEVRVLVATDIAARGLDIPHIECVVNYDLPQCPEDYVHRIGRTGRNGAEGLAVSLLSPADTPKWRLICKMLNPGDKSAQSEPRGRRGHGGGNPSQRRAFSGRRQDDTQRPRGEYRGNDSKPSAGGRRSNSQAPRGQYSARPDRARRGD